VWYSTKISTVSDNKDNRLHNTVNFGKLECRGVYSRIPKKTISPDDVPGAYINIDNFESCSIVQLKRWLECRGLKTTGNKPDLLQR
jgi:hypothetical protein